MGILNKALLTTQWAMQAEQLALIKAIAARDDLSALGFADGEPVANTRQAVELFGTTAVVQVAGPIFPKANFFTEMCGATSVECLVKDLAQVSENPQVENIVAVFDTPGGAVNGINEAAEYIAAMQARSGKKITAYVDGTCASAGYWLAASCAEIVISQTAQLGSIGAVLQYDTARAENSAELVSSRAKNKRPDLATAEGRDLMQATLDDIEDVFIESAAHGRGMTPAALAEAGNYGGILVGKKAVAAGLADRTGNLQNLITELNGTTPTNPTPRKRGTTMAYQTVDEMKADNPALCEQLTASTTAANKEQFTAEGISQERQRVTAIVGANVLGHESVRRTALLDGTDINALSTAVINAEQGKRREVIEGADNQEVAEIDALAAPAAAPQAKTAQQLKIAAQAHVKEQAAAGKTVSYEAAVELAAKGEI